jgi:hypothetical protein
VEPAPAAEVRGLIRRRAPLCVQHRGAEKPQHQQPSHHRDAGPYSAAMNG